MVLLSIAACIPVEPAPTGPITIELVNDTQLDVEPDFYVSATNAQPWNLFKDENKVEDFTDRAFPELRAKEKITLTYECNELVSFGSKTPTMVDAIAITRTESADQVYFVVGEDVTCEETVRFTYYYQDGVFHVKGEIR